MDSSLYLRDGLRRCRVVSDDNNRYFIPSDAFDTWLGNRLVRATIAGIVGQNYRPIFDQGLNNYQKLFATLVLVERLDVASRLFSSPYTDRDLPLSQNDIDSIDRTLSGTDFLREQYQFLVPKLGPVIDPPQWSADYILPIMKRTRLGSRSTGRGIVYLFYIHPLYDEFCPNDPVSSISA